MEVISVSAKKREELGKTALKAIRRNGEIPGVIYGKDNEPRNIKVTLEGVKKLVFTPDFKIAELSVEGASSKAIVKDMVFHPVTEDLLHIDFLELYDGHPVKVEVPVKFKGTSVGVKAGGTLQQNMRFVKIKAVPDALVDHLVLDISSINLGQSGRVRDLQVPEGVEIMSQPATPVVQVIIPRALRSAEAAASKENAAEKA